MKWIAEHREQFRISRMADVFELSPGGIYHYLKRPPSQRSRENKVLVEKIKVIHQDSRQSYGSPRVTAVLHQQGVQVSQKRVAHLMRINMIRAKRKRRFICTTDSNHSRPIVENVLNRSFEVTQPNRVWVGDITYIPTAEGWLYLATVMDLHSRKIVGWSMDKNMPAELVCRALDMALQQRDVKPGLIFHSDRGSQYASELFQSQLKRHKMVQSMSRKGNCWDNACMESFFGSLKLECYDKLFKSRKQARLAIFEYIEGFYNRQRLHSTLGYLSPEQFEQQHVS